MSEASEHGAGRDLEQKFVVAGHRLEERAQFEVIDYHGHVAGKLALDVEVGLSVHEQWSHTATLRRTDSYVSPYFCAIAAA